MMANSSPNTETSKAADLLSDPSKPGPTPTDSDGSHTKGRDGTTVQCHILDPEDGVGAELVVREGWECETEAEAAWAVDIVLSYDERLERLDEAHRTYRAQLERERQRAVEFFEPHLREFYEANPPKRGKTIKLVTGRIGFRKVGGGPRIQDKEKVLEWAREHRPDLVEVETRESVPAAGVKDHVGKTGEIPPGVVVLDDEERFQIKPKGFALLDLLLILFVISFVVGSVVVVAAAAWVVLKKGGL